METEILNVILSYINTIFNLAKNTSAILTGDDKHPLRIPIYIAVFAIIFLFIQIRKNNIKTPNPGHKQKKVIRVFSLLQFVIIFMIIVLIVVLLCGILPSPQPSSSSSTTPTDTTQTSPTPSPDDYAQFSKWWDNTLHHSEYAICKLTADYADVYEYPSLNKGYSYAIAKIDYTDEIHLYSIVMDLNPPITITAHIDYPVNDTRKSGYIILDKIIAIDKKTSQEMNLNQNTRIYTRPNDNCPSTNPDHLNAGQKVYYLSQREDGKWQQVLYCDRNKNNYIYWIKNDYASKSQ